MRLFIGNLEYQVTERELRDLFLQHVGVEGVEIPRDRDGRPRGFGFVELVSSTDADLAIKALNEAVLRGRPIRIEVAKSRSADGGRAGRP